MCVGDMCVGDCLIEVGMVGGAHGVTSFFYKLSDTDTQTG